MTPLALFQMQTSTARLMWEAQTVMALRIMGMSGTMRARPDENFVMIAEKGPALLRAAFEANKALLSGKSPDKIWAASMKPVARKVRANKRRLLRVRTH